MVSDSAIKRFVGNGSSGYSDGDLDSGVVMFNKPRSFAVDLRGNVYVADKMKRTIRKITTSGTIICSPLCISPHRLIEKAQILFGSETILVNCVIPFV